PPRSPLFPYTTLFRSLIREQTLGEEIANAISHGLGCLLAIASLPILVHHAALRGDPAQVVAASVFAGTAILLYLVSTLYHALPADRKSTRLNSSHVKI